MARSRARARVACSAQGQPWGRCKVSLRAERVSRPAIERSLGLIHQTDEEGDAAFLKILEESQTEERVSREEVMGILEDRDEG